MTDGTGLEDLFDALQMALARIIETFNQGRLFNRLSTQLEVLVHNLGLQIIGKYLVGDDVVLGKC